MDTQPQEMLVALVEAAQVVALQHLLVEQEHLGKVSRVALVVAFPLTLAVAVAEPVRLGMQEQALHLTDKVVLVRHHL